MKFLAVVAAVCCLLFTTALSAAAAAPVRPAVAASCVYAKVGGKRKCLRRGEYCARRYQSTYHRYGFTCSKRDYRGDWHLEYY